MNGTNSASACRLLSALVVVGWLGSALRAEDAPKTPKPVAQPGGAAPADDLFDSGQRTQPATKPAPPATQKPVTTAVTKPAANLPAKADAATDFCRCTDRSDSETTRKIEAALRGPLTATGIDFADTPLSNVIDQLSSDYEIPIQLNKPALEEAGIGTDSPVTINVHHISLESGLRLILNSLNLTYVIQNEVLTITTKEDAEKQLKICVYEVRSITGERNEKDVESLVDTIQSCIATETWAENGGGQAEIRVVRPAMLVISQTQAVHDEIRNLLTTLRTLRQARGPNAAASDDENGDRVVTRSYILQLRHNNEKDDIDSMRAQVRELITQSLPEEKWSGKLGDGQAVTLTVFPDRIVVRHKEGVQDRLQKILAEAGVAMPAMMPGPSAFGTFVPGGRPMAFGPQDGGPTSAPGYRPSYGPEGPGGLPTSNPGYRPSPGPEGPGDVLEGGPEGGPGVGPPGAPDAPDAEGPEPNPFNNR